ncbi:MAG TPA: hypothetical protein VH988_06850 [Thermoanaerobaculia bacterium]|nr:hypothetical protein [Thermoanaerobaculia bacterium]
MRKKISEQIGERSSLLLKVAGNLNANGFDGEVKFYIRGRTAGEITWELTRLGLVSPGISTSSGYTGKLSIQGLFGRGEMVIDSGTWTCSGTVSTRVLYREVERQKGFEQIEPGRFHPDFETFEGTIQLSLEEREREGLNSLEVTAGALSLQWLGGGLGWIPVLNVPLDGQSFTLSSLSTAATGEILAVAPCPSELRGERRQLKVRPIFFRASAADPSPTGGSWQTQLAKAQEVWGRCCIEILPQEAQYVVDGNLKTSTAVEVIWNRFDDPDIKTVDVFFVDSILPNGGGASSSFGSSLAKIALTDRNAGNPTLLAHELGHILGGLHPGSRPDPPAWIADPGTVLEPSGSPNLPSPSLNTLGNCRRADNTSLISTGNGCCIQPSPN